MTAVATAPAPPKPAAPRVNFNALPTAIKEKPQWNPWRWVLRTDEKTSDRYWAKVPHTVKGAWAKTSDLSTWSAFDDVVTAYQASIILNKGRQAYDGIGYLILPGEIGVDLDNCLGDGVPQPWAIPIIQKLLPSYGETSPRGRGLKFIVQGEALPIDKTGGNFRPLPATWEANEGSAVEIYHRKFFTLTGAIFPGASSELCERGDYAHSLFCELQNERQSRRRQDAHSGNAHAMPSPATAADAEIIAKAKSFKNGDAFARLWAGDVSGYESQSQADAALCNMLAFVVGPDDARIDQFFRQSGLYRDKWDRDDYGRPTIELALSGRGPDDFYKWPKPRKKKQKRPIVSTATAAQPQGTNEPAENCASVETGGDGLPSVIAVDGQNDIANAMRFAYLHGDDVRYCESVKSWLLWDGKRWAIDDALAIHTRARGVPAYLWKKIGDLATELSDDDLRSAVKFATNASNDRGLSAMLRQARSQPGIPIRPVELDTDEWLLCCPNGTLDLRTGELRPHDRGDLITKLCPTPYHPNAPAPLWESFLNKIMGGNQSLITFLQRAFGYSLTGSVCEELLFFCYGKGRNGKSKCLGAIQHALGSDFSMEAPHDLLMATKDKKHSTELTDLKGKRFVTAIENEDGQKLAEALVKKLTGGDRIRARRVFENCTEFSPTHKVWLAANHKPVIRGSDDAIWERLRVIPFTVFIPPEERIKDLDKQLAAEAQGILAWCVRGCLDWQKATSDGGGLTTPPEVMRATNQYRNEEDSVARFVQEFCLAGNGYKVKLSKLRDAYNAWTQDQGITAVSGRRFGEWLGDHEFKSHTSNGTWYSGIGLRDDNWEAAKQ